MRLTDARPQPSRRQPVGGAAPARRRDGRAAISVAVSIVTSVVLAAGVTTIGGLAGAAAAQETRAFIAGTGAVLQGLDKVTATVTTFTAPLDTKVRFGTLDITVRSCQKTPPTERPEQAAFLEIDETNPNAEAARLYSGWMFASSPALAALEHPVYDVWVIDCMNASSSAEDNSSGN